MAQSPSRRLFTPTLNLHFPGKLRVDMEIQLPCDLLTSGVLASFSVAAQVAGTWDLWAAWSPS